MNVDSRTGHGLDRQQVLRMLTSTIFDCAIYRGYGDRIARRDHSEGGFSMANGLKDARLIRDAAAATPSKCRSTSRRATPRSARTICTEAAFI